MQARHIHVYAEWKL